MTATQIQAEALSRARGGMSARNYATILAGFTAKGIAAVDIQPRVNIYTYNAWRALGRQVRRGEHGVKVCTFKTADRAPKRRPGESDSGYRQRTQRGGGSIPWTATVFHISQTDQIGGGS